MWKSGVVEVSGNLSRYGGAGYRWLILFLAWLIYFTFGLFISSIPPFMTPIIRDLNLTYTQAGMILGAWQLSYIIVAFTAGLLIDRLGTKRALAFAVAVITISEGLRGFATNFETLYVSTAIFGVGGSLISIGLSKLVASYFTGDDRRTAIGIYGTGGLAGSAVSMAIANTVMLPIAGTWQNALRLYALFGMLVLIVWLLVGRDSTRRSEEEQSQLTSTFKTILKNRDVWVIVAIGFSCFFVAHGLSNWLPKMLESRGMTPADAGLITLMYTTTRVFSGLFSPRLSDRMRSRKRPVILILVLAGISLFLLTVVGSGPILWVVLIFNGVTQGGLWPLLMLCLMDLPDVGPKYMGSASGLFFTFGEVGGSLAPFLMGYLRDLTGSFLAGVGILIIVAEVMVPLAFLLRD